MTQEKVEVTSAKEEKKKEPSTSKVVIRRLPPGLSEESLVEQISPIPEHDYFQFYAPDYSLGVNASSRAYINFLSQEDILIFCEKFDEYVFVDSKGNESSAIVEFAPFQKIPKKKPKKIDTKKGTLESDEDYKKFLISHETPNNEPMPAPETYLEEIEAKEKELKANKGLTQLSTPLLEYLKRKREEKRALFQRARDERKRRDIERKRQRDDEKRRRKDRDRERYKEKERGYSERQKEEPQIKLLKNTDRERNRNRVSDDEIKNNSRDWGRNREWHEDREEENDREMEDRDMKKGQVRDRNKDRSWGRDQGKGRSTQSKERDKDWNRELDKKWEEDFERETEKKRERGTDKSKDMRKKSRDEDDEDKDDRFKDRDNQQEKRYSSGEREEKYPSGDRGSGYSGGNSERKTSTGGREKSYLNQRPRANRDREKGAKTDRLDSRESEETERVPNYVKKERDIKENRFSKEKNRAREREKDRQRLNRMKKTVKEQDRDERESTKDRSSIPRDTDDRKKEKERESGDEERNEMLDEMSPDRRGSGEDSVKSGDSGRKDSDSKSRQRIRNKDRPERAIYVPGRRAVERERQRTPNLEREDSVGSDRVASPGDANKEDAKDISTSDKTETENVIV